MRRKMAFGSIGLMVLLAAAVVTWAQQGPPQAPPPGQGQHQFGQGGPRQWGDGPHRFEGGGQRGQFGMRGRMGGPEMGRRMGWQHGWHRGFGGEGMLRLAENPRVRQALGLTDDQVARLHTLAINAEKASIQNRADMELRRIELRELMRADNPNHDAIMAKLDEVNALQGKMAKERVETFLSARSVLTPEQIQKVKTFMENREDGGMGMRRGPMEHRGGVIRPGGPGAPAAPNAAPPKPPAPQA